VTTSQPVAAARLDTATWIFTLDDFGAIRYGKLAYAAGALTLVSGSGLGSMSMIDANGHAWAARTIAASRTLDAAGNAVIDLVAIDDKQRVQYTVLHGSTTVDDWQYAPAYAAVAAAPAIDSNGTLYVRGFNGRIYGKHLGGTAAYVQLTGL